MKKDDFIVNVDMDKLDRYRKEHPICEYCGKELTPEEIKACHVNSVGNGICFDCKYSDELEEGKTYIPSEFLKRDYEKLKNDPMTGRYEDGSLKKSYKVIPPNIKSNKETSTLSTDRIKEIVDIIIDEDYDGAYEYVGGASGSIYYYLQKELFNPECDYGLENLDRFNDVDINDKKTLKAIALQLIEDVCKQEGWSVYTAKKQCEY